MAGAPSRRLSSCQTNAALNARVRPNRPHCYRCRVLVVVALAKLAPNHLVAPPALFSPCRGRIRLPLHRRRTRPPRYAGSTRSSGSRARSGHRRGSTAAHDPQRLVQCFVGHWHAIVIGRPADLGSASRDQRFRRVGLAPSATESTPEVVQHEVSVSLGIVGHNGWGTHDKTLP